MKVLIFLGLLCIAVSNLAFAMSYMPIPFENQLSESYGVVEARFLSKEYKKNRKNEVVTVNTFEVDKFIGLKKNEVLNQKSFQVITPGGVWQDEVYLVHGVPKFTQNEKVILLLKKGEQGFYLNNQALGKYRVLRSEGKKVVSSSVFPGHSKLGKIDYSEYERLVHRHFNKGFIGFDKGKKFSYQNKTEKDSKSGRRPASANVKRKKSITGGNSINIMWIVLLLGVMGLISTVYIRKN